MGPWDIQCQHQLDIGIWSSKEVSSEGTDLGVDSWSHGRVWDNSGTQWGCSPGEHEHWLGGQPHMKSCATEKEQRERVFIFEVGFRSTALFASLWLILVWSLSDIMGYIIFKFSVSLLMGKLPKKVIHLLLLSFPLWKRHHLFRQGFTILQETAGYMSSLPLGAHKCQAIRYKNAPSPLIEKMEAMQSMKYLFS